MLHVKWLTFMLLTFAFSRKCSTCGSLTHMEIAIRAAEFFNVTYKGLDIRQLAFKYPEILRTGAVFPDSFYNDACFSGKFHETSEMTHWMTFIKASLDYFAEKYESKPIDTAGEKLLVFILGIISHDVADVLWHSLGIDQGFIDTMAHLNFHGNYQAAHTIADPGGDSVNLYELNFQLSRQNEKLKWYVPIDDILNIFAALKIPAFNRTIIKTCAVDLMQVESAGELEIFEKLYPLFMSKSSFLGSARFLDYFLGGLNEMSSWTMNRWMTAFMYLENKGVNCTNTEPGGVNPFYWICGQQPPIKPPAPGKVGKVSYNKSLPKKFLAKEKMSIFTKIQPKKQNQSCKTWDFYVKKPYSMLGQSLISTDLNSDGYDDVIIGAPGFSLDNRFQEGRVFVVFGSENPMPEADFDLEAKANFVFESPSSVLSSRFGYSVAALDFNGDSHFDIAISAPLHSHDAVNALYSGRVYIYFGNNNRDGLFSFNTTRPDVIIDCKMRYCNYGSSLSVADLNNDGKVDLVISSPYASQSFKSMRQNGFVSAFFSGSHESALLEKKDSDLLLWGATEYSWFGYSVISTPFCSLLIGAPGEQVILSNGTLLQMAGAVYCYNKFTKKLNLFANGANEFANFGSALSFGFPNGKNSPPIAAISAPNDDNSGKHFGLIPLNLRQSGSVYFFSPLYGMSLGKLAGDRHFGAFGRFIQFVDVNNDGFDDLFIGAPVRQRSLFSEMNGDGDATGELFLFSGSTSNGSFPQNVIRKVCQGDIEPCPEEQADQVFAIAAERAQFGSNAAILRSPGVDDSVRIIVAAQRSDQYGRQAGKLVLFHCNNSTRLKKLSV